MGEKGSLFRGLFIVLSFLMGMFFLLVLMCHSDKPEVIEKWGKLAAAVQWA